MLRGRSAECAAVGKLLADARNGVSGALVLRAEAGMGKTAMMAYGIGAAAGMQVIAAAAAAGEYRLPFACLHRLLAGWADRAGEIPQVQREVLLGALALGPPPRPEDRFALHVAVLSTLGVIADAGPVLVAVDDAQWLDEPTAGPDPGPGKGTVSSSADAGRGH